MTIDLKDLQIIFRCCYKTARKKRDLIKKDLGIENDLTAYHVAEFLRIPEERIANKLKI